MNDLRVYQEQMMHPSRSVGGRNVLSKKELTELSTPLGILQPIMAFGKIEQISKERKLLGTRRQGAFF